MSDEIVDTVRIRAILFDVDDTLYDKSTGFSDHRNNYGVQQFMVQHLNFPNVQSAKRLRDEYFQRYHSTAKALVVAEQEGRFPAGTTKAFDPRDLDEFFATKLDFTLLGGPKRQVAEDLQKLGQHLYIAAFSNGPRKYVQRVLTELQLWDETLFHDKNLFAVNDTLPYCKPEKEAFDFVLAKLGVAPNECILVEDSMKNIRIAKSLGMKTILVVGDNSRLGSTVDDNTTDCLLANDLPVSDDPSVDAVIPKIENLRISQPGLWENPPFLSQLTYEIL